MFYMDITTYEDAYLKTRRGLGKRKRRINLFKINNNASILDYGCGDGLDLIAFHELGYKNVIGIDNSSNLLAKINGHKIVLTDAHNTGFKGNIFDVVFINSVIHHLNVIKSLQEIKRILKKNGGILCIIEQRDSILRKIFDLITFSPLSSIHGILKNRRIALTEEYEIYKEWLRLGKKISTCAVRYDSTNTKENNFEVQLYKKGPIGVYIKAVSRG